MRDPVMTISWLLAVVTGTVCAGPTTGAAAIALLPAATAPSATPARRIVSNLFIFSPVYRAPDRGCGTLVRNGGILAELRNRRKRSVTQPTQLSAADAKQRQLPRGR